MKISVVVPSLNGWDRLGKLCRKINTSLITNSNVGDFEIIIVDDGSEKRPDNLIEDLQSTGVDIKGVFLNKNYGQQFATLAGLHEASGDFTITMDDDLSHNPDDFVELISLMEDDKFDAVFGIPKSSGSGLLRRGGSGIRDTIFDVFFRKPKDVYVSSFRILSRTLVDKIIGDISEYKYLSVEILKHTQKIGNIKVDYNRNSTEGSRYGLIELSLLAFSLVSCSRIYPRKIRSSKKAAEMEWVVL